MTSHHCTSPFYGGGKGEGRKQKERGGDGGGKGEEKGAFNLQYIHFQMGKSPSIITPD